MLARGWTITKANILIRIQIAANGHTAQAL
jgi:hypothetical protein